MADAAHITELQAVDLAFGHVVAGAYEGLAPSGTRAFIRFLERDTKHKIWRAQNENLRSLLIRIAGKVAGKTTGAPLPDLPVVAYYRSPGLSGGENRPVAFSRLRYRDDLERPMVITTVPITLQYMLAFCAWDKPTLDKLTVAWWAYVGHVGRKHSRFIVKYPFGPDTDGDGDNIIEIPATMTATRDILTEDAGVDQAEGRLWAARTMVEVETQVLYGRDVPPREEIYIGGAERLLT